MIKAASILSLKRDVSEKLDGVVLVSLQHLLPSIVPLFNRLVSAGIDPTRIFIMGKPYSTIPSVVSNLGELGCYVHLPNEKSLGVGSFAERFRSYVQGFWRVVRNHLPATVKRLVVLDEGGWLSREIPSDLVEQYSVVAVEHTMYGVFTFPSGGRSYPVVLMAASAAKTRFESPVIADAIVGRLWELIPFLDKMHVGIIGLGNVGQAVAKSLSLTGVGRLSGYDVIEHKGSELGFVRRLNGVREIVTQCEVILGCTGVDTLNPDTVFQKVKEGDRRWLASCSSGDIEFFRTAIRLAKKNPTFRANPYRDMRGKIGEREVILLNGGFPLNFDREVEREQPSRIQLTRELTYASVLQAILCITDDHTGGIMLDPDIQRSLVQEWLVGADARYLFPNWEPHSSEWWGKHSLGIKLNNSLEEFLNIIPDGK